MPEYSEKERRVVNCRNKFKKFGGQRIPDVIEYIKEYIKENPYATISLGCDSVQRRKKTVYAITLMFYSISIKNGAHVIYFRDNINKVRDNFDRLGREADYVLNIGEWINNELEGQYVRMDLSDSEQRRYKFHLAKCNGEFAHVDASNEETVVKNLTLTDADKIRFSGKLIDLHLDFNPFEGSIDKKGYAKNKSNQAYNAYVGGIRGMGYRVFCKPCCPAASSAADLLLKH